MGPGTGKAMNDCIGKSATRGAICRGAIGRGGTEAQRYQAGSASPPKTMNWFKKLNESYDRDSFTQKHDILLSFR